MSVFARSVTPCVVPVVPSLAKTTFGNLRNDARELLPKIKKAGHYSGHFSTTH
jgi:hypothetical protein